MLTNIILILTGLFILALILAPIYYMVQRDKYDEKSEDNEEPEENEVPEDNEEPEDTAQA